MELWIRTQDRMTLIRSYEIYIVEQQNMYLIRAKRTSHILGSYSTFERSLEVLDEIQETMCLDEGNYENKDKTCYQDCYRYKSNVIAIYEMPEE